MTEETQQDVNEASDITPTVNKSTSNNADSTKSVNVRKEKCRPMTKVVVRRLPPTMTQEQFIEQVSPLPEYNYLYLAKADMSLGQFAFSRAYIDFVNQEDIFNFREKFDNYVFVDSKGTEYQAVVEFAPFQRIPKKRVGKKKDLKCGTIESDPYYISFLESLKIQEIEANSSQPKTEYSFQLSDLVPKKVTSTPLLDYLKQKKQEKQRIRDEKREERRKRDIERRKVKEVTSATEKLDPDKGKEKIKESSKDRKENKDENEQLAQKDLKNRRKKDEFRNKDKNVRESKFSNKVYKEDNSKNAKFNKKYEDKKGQVKRETEKDSSYSKESGSSHKDKKVETKRGKSYEKMRQEKKRSIDSQKKQNSESTQDQEGTEVSTLPEKEEKQNESLEVAISESLDANEVFEQNNKENSESLKCTESEQLTHKGNLRSSNSQDCINTDPEFLSNKRQIPKRRSSLESGNDTGSNITAGCSENETEKLTVDRRNFESGSLRRHKSLDGANSNSLKSNENIKTKDKKDPRLERRIRNKDRPAMEIYRPGMGKFSKQRLEREKGSDDKPTPSQSPTRSGSIDAKNTKSEVRTMTFKRSVSRDFS